MKGAILALLLISVVTACSNSDQPSLKALNAKCAQGKLIGQYLVKLSTGEIKKVHASSYTDLIKKINSSKVLVTDIDYNFSHSIKLSKQNDLNNPQEDPGIGRYGQVMIGATKLWEQNIFGENTTIAVIDTGLDIENTLLSNSIFINKNELGSDEDKNGLVNDTHGWDFVNNLPLTKDLQTHGTEVTSIIAAEHLNGLKIGLAPKTKILPIAALKPNIDGTDAAGSSNTLIKAVNYATLMNVDFINASWGGDNCSDLLRKAVLEATQKGIIFITSAGNDNENIDINLEFPSSFTIPRVISVGGVDASSQKVSSSNYGNRVNFFAPGGDILTLRAGADFNFTLVTGTSIATPFISGSLALLKSAFPHSSSDQLLDALNISMDEFKIPFLPVAFEQLNHAQPAP